MSTGQFKTLESDCIEKLYPQSLLFHEEAHTSENGGFNYLLIQGTLKPEKTFSSDTSTCLINMQKIIPTSVCGILSITQGKKTMWL